jgi:hypothetical protein
VWTCEYTRYTAHLVAGQWREGCHWQWIAALQALLPNPSTAINLCAAGSGTEPGILSLYIRCRDSSM